VYHVWLFWFYFVVVVFSAEKACNAPIIASTALEKETKTTVKAPQVAEVPPLYSFSLKRSNSNTVDDGNNRKKVTKSVVTNENSAVGRASKFPAPASKNLDHVGLILEKVT
jgi:hypothetical protein